MAATTFEDRLAKLAAEGPAGNAPQKPLPTAAPPPQPAQQLGSLRDEPDPASGLKTLLAFFGGAFLGLLLATIISVGLIEGSPWGLGSDLFDIVMLPTFAVALLLLIALIPSTVFFRSAPKSFAFVASALSVLMIGLLV